MPERNTENLPEIRVLPDDVANKIAAGEVVERPASVVKELVENSIDAGATRIDIEFKNGGKSFIKVSDNGIGMTPNQAVLCLEPHATSKIRSAPDLNKITSYGFRGEAIPSIASVSRFTLKTRPAGSAEGTLVKVVGGQIEESRSCGMAFGTEIVVESLFCSVPARRKFLKSDAVEAGHIVKLCRLYALALPHISFSLAENSRVLFRSEKNPDIIGRVDKIFGREISSKIIPLKKVSSGAMSVEGAVLKPGEFCASTKYVCTYINSRPVDLRAAYYAIKDAYGASIPRGKYAAAFLFINIPPEDVDVNVHPAKREVRLKNEFIVRDFLYENILRTLENFSLMPSGVGKSALKPQYVNQHGVLEFHRGALLEKDQKDGADATNSKAEEKASFICHNPEERKPENAAKLNISKDTFAAEDYSHIPLKSTPAQYEGHAISGNISFQEFIDDGQLQNKDAGGSALANGWEFLAFYREKYILFQTPKALVMMSVPAALKRINYENILKSKQEEHKAASQRLAISPILNLDRASAEFFESALEHFNTCGFDIEPFGKGTYKIRAVPTWLETSPEKFLKDFLEEAQSRNVSIKSRRIERTAFALMAVKRAFGAGIPQTKECALKLLEELFSCSMPMLSPDGKPTCKEIDFPFK